MKVIKDYRLLIKGTKITPTEEFKKWSKEYRDIYQHESWQKVFKLCESSDIRFKECSAAVGGFILTISGNGMTEQIYIDSEGRRDGFYLFALGSSACCSNPLIVSSFIGICSGGYNVKFCKNCGKES